MYRENVIIKDWRDIDLSFGLIYPNTYKIGMSSYSIRLLYYLINCYDNIVCERIFLPDNVTFPASKDYSSENQIRSIENKIHPNEFDILGFSFQFENDFKNILWILEKAGIPLTHADRKKRLSKRNVNYPIIIGGGPVITSNPMPLSKIFDFCFIGDVEMKLDDMLKTILLYKFKEIDLQELLNRIKLIEGIFVPSLNNKVNRVILENLDESPVPEFQLISKTSGVQTIFEENFFLEINRGCPFQCKFCISSFHNYPYRIRSFEDIKRAIEEGIKNSDFDTISLIGPCVSSHPKFYDICEYILRRGKRLTVPSIRIEHLTSNIINILEKNNIKTITIAPETGSEKLRFSLGKKISDEQIFSVLMKVKQSKIKNVKFYFLIGLPDETEDDIDKIITFLKKVSELGFEKNTLRVNVNPLIPKLNTPYEKKVDFYQEENYRSFMLKFKKIEKELKHLPSIKLKFQNPKLIMNNARLQTLLSLGNEEVSNLLLHYYSNGASFGALRRAEKTLNFSIDEYLLRIKSGYSPWIF
jgi:radical SAM superfamily enzyme YgiQ (UPF0313 family)